MATAYPGGLRKRGGLLDYEDTIQATPRNPFLGGVADLLGQAYKLPEMPRMGVPGLDFMAANRNRLLDLLGVGDVQKTAEAMSYGNRLGTGAGMTYQPLPETVGAAMAVAPLAGKAIRATEGMPVGASIKVVNKSAITREGNPIQGAVVLIGDKIFMGRTHGDAFNRAIYEGVIRKEGGKYIYPKDAEVNSDLFMTKDGQIIDRFQASKMFDIGASETAIEKGLMQNNPPKSMTVDSYIEQATALKKQREQSPYPQAEALRLAQQRAALPVEQGGLGLPATNTAIDRAKAMGFESGWAHGSPRNDITELRPSRFGAQGPGIYATNYLPEASTYAGTNEGATVYPLMVRRSESIDTKFNNPYDELGVNADDALLSEMFGRNKSAIVTTQEKTPDWLLRTGALDMPQRKHFVSVRPENFRSRFAAFDPFRRTAATAAAMGVAAPDLLATEIPEEIKRRQMRGLLTP